MPKTPLLSIGMPVYNGDKFLAETFENLLGQTFGDFDLVISDNASTDGTRDICEGFAAKDSRIDYHLQESNVGAGPNHNYVVHASTAPLFKMAAHDDLHAPTYLEKCVAVLNDDPDVVLSHSDSTLIGDDGEPLVLDPETQMFDDPITGEKLPHEPVDVAEGDSSNERFSEVLHKFIWCSDMYGVMRREALNQTSLFRSFYGSDKVFLAEMALLGKFHHVREVLFLKRYHSEMSATMTDKERQQFMDTSATKKKSPYMQIFKGYTRAALRTGSLDLVERSKCLGSVAHKTVVARYWRT